MDLLEHKVLRVPKEQMEVKVFKVFKEVLEIKDIKEQLVALDHRVLVAQMAHKDIKDTKD